MKYYSLILSVMSIVFMAEACSSVNDNSPAFSEEMREMVFTAESGEVYTKTAFQADETSIWWSPADEICVYYGNSNKNKFTATNGVEVARAEFRGTLNAFTGENESSEAYSFWAVYPYASANSFDGSSVVATLSEEQIAKVGSFSPNTNIAIAKSSGLNLSFFNACSWFRFSVVKEGVKRVSFHGNNNEDIAGEFRVSMGDDNRPTAPLVLDGKKTIILHLPNYESFEVGKLYYITLLPQVFSDGFTVTFETGTETGSRSIDTQASYLRSKYNTGINFDQDIVYTQTSPIDFNDNTPILQVNVAEAGTLLSQLDVNTYQSIKKLKLTGEINSSDVVVLRRMTGLSYLDLSDVRVRSGGTSYYFDGSPTFSAGYHSIENDDEIGELMFSKMQDLKTVIIPNNIKAIRFGAFCYSGLESLDLPNSVTTIENGAFLGTHLKTIYIPDSVVLTYFENPAVGPTCTSNELFKACFELQSARLPSNWDRIPRETFSECSSLSTISIPEGVTSLDNRCFDGCTSLNSITLPSTLTKIGIGAFTQVSIETITIPSGVETIGYYAFDACSLLREVHIKANPQTLQNIDINAFGNLDKSQITLYIPIGTLSSYLLTPLGDFPNIIEE